MNYSNPNSLNYCCYAKLNLHKNLDVHQKVVLTKFTFHDIATTNKYDLTTKAMMVKNLLGTIVTLTNKM